MIGRSAGFYSELFDVCTELMQTIQEVPQPVIAKVHGVTPAQVVLRWHIEHGITVIPKSVNPERIATNFDLMRFTLEPDQVARIDTLSRR